MQNANTRAILCLSVMLFLPGCSTFNRDWKAAAQTPSPASDIYGRWQGAWLSDKNGHTDKLSCLVTKLDDRNYRARYRAHFVRILRFGYTVHLKVEENNGRFRFEGDENLGRMIGGVYHYAGEATPTNFVLTYQCKGDFGTFQMTRPQ